jgi:hypothetical protein
MCVYMGVVQYKQLWFMSGCQQCLRFPPLVEHTSALMEHERRLATTISNRLGCTAQVRVMHCIGLSSIRKYRVRLTELLIMRCGPSWEKLERPSTGLLRPAPGM